MSNVSHSPIYVWCIYGSFGREITNYTVIHGIYGSGQFYQYTIIYIQSYLYTIAYILYIIYIYIYIYTLNPNPKP